ncbi:hypothetical protein V6N13_032126 [Hibiscus sabdariffa]
MSRPGIALALFLAAQGFLFLGVQASRLFTFLGEQASRLGLHPIHFACICSDLCLGLLIRASWRGCSLVYRTLLRMLLLVVALISRPGLIVGH